MPQSLVHKGFLFLPLCKEFQKSAETQKKNFYMAAVFEHSFSIKQDWKASSKWNSAPPEGSHRNIIFSLNCPIHAASLSAADPQLG